MASPESTESSSDAKQLDAQDEKPRLDAREWKVVNGHLIRTIRRQPHERSVSSRYDIEAHGILPRLNNEVRSPRARRKLDLSADLAASDGGLATRPATSPMWSTSPRRAATAPASPAESMGESFRSTWSVSSGSELAESVRTLAEAYVLSPSPRAHAVTDKGVLPLDNLLDLVPNKAIV